MIVLFALLLLTSAPAVFSQRNIDPKDIREKMQWFADARPGIFVHTGIYSVNGIDESWSF
jgi:alpha-L-fucosidase